MGPMGADHVSYCKKNECCMPNGNWVGPSNTEGDATTGRKKYQCRPPVEGKCSVMANSFFHKENYSRCIRSNAGQKEKEPIWSTAQPPQQESLSPTPKTAKRFGM